ncbi:class I SAM-dependent methyltransferase [Achromobacter ruhlandii]|uniref:class I SAM-dependent methyltransferase n=1 Tax=Achromobacter ruhlandii TaxID=72557 RepID=UPI003B9DFA98
MSSSEQSQTGKSFAYDRAVSERLLPTHGAVTLFSLQHDRGSEQITSFSADRNIVAQPRGGQTFETIVMLHADQEVHSDLVVIGSEHVIDLSLCIQGGAPEAFPPTITVRCIDEDGVSREVLNFHLHLKDPALRQDVLAGLSHVVGKTVRFTLGIRQTGRPTRSVGISRFMVCPKHSLERVHALTNYGLRVKNELSNYAENSYTHSMYGNGQTGDGESSLIERASSQALKIGSFLQEQERRLHQRLEEIQPKPDEAVYVFAQRCLEEILPIRPFDFLERIVHLSSNRQLRILSLCSGSAWLEEKILGRAADGVDITFFDMSEPLIKRAASRINNGRHKIRYLVGDINNGIPTTETYDLIICVSALHHVVELELVLAQINERLAPGGEFWNLGEQIGRNGNRLWPEARIAANLAFSKLPDRLRINAITKMPDAEIPDDDFSVGCFEGIRSESIARMLEAFLTPVDVYKRNCFLWRLTDGMYCENYSLSSDDDLSHLRKLVVAEAIHWLQGGRGVEMHAIYKRREF